MTCACGHVVAWWRGGVVGFEKHHFISGIKNHGRWLVMGWLDTVAIKASEQVWAWCALHPGHEGFERTRARMLVHHRAARQQAHVEAEPGVRGLALPPG